MAQGEPPQAEAIFGKPFPVDGWPEVATRVIAWTADRMFSLGLVERVARERLDFEAASRTADVFPASGTAAGRAAAPGRAPAMMRT